MQEEGQDDGRGERKRLTTTEREAADQVPFVSSTMHADKGQQMPLMYSTMHADKGIQATRCRARSAVLKRECAGAREHPARTASRRCCGQWHRCPALLCMWKGGRSKSETQNL